jgi:hypothetical protein
MRVTLFPGEPLSTHSNGKSGPQHSSCKKGFLSIHPPRGTKNMRLRTLFFFWFPGFTRDRQQSKSVLTRTRL